MDTQAFTQAYNESRIGTNKFYFHQFNRKFEYSDGIKQCADLGCRWLLDIAATELPGVFQTNSAISNLGILIVQVSQGVASLSLEFTDDVTAWSRTIKWTDLPEGKWTFYIADEGHRFAMILPNEY